MFRWLTHSIYGCFSNEPSLGYGKGMLIDKNNKAALQTKGKYWFYKCDWCGHVFTDFREHINKEKKQ